MLTSWANLYGTKYRDLSESRAQAREQTQVRLQEAIEEEHARSHQLIMADRTIEAQSAAEMARIEEENRQPEPVVDESADMDSREATRQAEARVREAAAREAFRQAAERVREAAARDSSWHSPQRAEDARPQGFSAPAVSVPEPEELKPCLPQAPLERPIPIANALPLPIAIPLPPAAHLQPAPVFEEGPALPPDVPIVKGDSRENTERQEPTTPVRTDEPVKHGTVKQEPLHDRDQQSASRWFALRTVFDFSNPAPVEPEAAQPPAPAPVIAVFSLAGGIGKTSLVATLGRALSARGERVLLVDTAAYGLMPFYFGAHDHRSGVLRTFSPPGTVGDSPIQMLALDPENFDEESAASDPLVSEIGKYSRGVSRVLIDLATASGATSRRVMKMAPMVLVPVIPDMNSVVSVSSIDRFFQSSQNGSSLNKPTLPFYVLNRFDATVPLHVDIREMLRKQLGERLLPFVLHRSPSVTEALAEGMTVMDYAPESTVAGDFGTLAGWVKSQSAPAVRANRGVRWSEK